MYKHYTKFIHTENHLLNHWFKTDIQSIVDFLYHFEYFIELKKILSTQSNQLLYLHNYYNMMSICHFIDKEYEKAIYYYKLIQNRTIQEEKKLLISYAHIKHWSSLKQELLRYSTHTKNQETKKILSFIKENDVFIPFLDTEEYAIVKKVLE